MLFVYNQSETMNTDSSYPNNTEVGDYMFQLWDMEKSSMIKSFPCKKKEWIHEMAFGYPYLLTKTDALIYIRDLSSDSNEPIKSLDMTLKVESFSINSHGFSFTQTRSYFDIKVIFGELKKNEPIEWSVLSDCESANPISLLHHQFLIYTTTSGQLRVRDVTKEGLPDIGDDLIAPELLAKKDAFESMDESEYYTLLRRNNVTSMIAHENTLVTLSEQNLCVWDLEKTILIKKFPNLGHMTLDALSGHTLIAHIPGDDTIDAFDLASKDKLVPFKQWPNPNRYSSFHPASYHSGKVYILDQKEKDRESILVVHDYSKKV